MSDSTNDNTKSTAEKTEGDAATPKVHSANSWEKADLGDADRKSKFLRLMGASKKEHQGRFVIGDQDTATTRDKHDVTRMSSQLEEQYEQGMEHRRIGGRRGHVGLGFHDEEKKEQETEESTKEEKTEEKDEETGEKEQSKPEECEKRKQSDDSEETKNDNENESPAKKMKMNFVKSSS